jgi:hypothetical protein
VQVTKATHRKHDVYGHMFRAQYSKFLDSQPIPANQLMIQRESTMLEQSNTNEMYKSGKQPSHLFLRCSTQNLALLAQKWHMRIANTYAQEEIEGAFAVRIIKH